MDPTTTIPPPSPEKPPPPQNPHTPTDEPRTSRNMDNFKAIAVKLAGRFLPAHQSLIHRRFDDILPNELLVPNHPPYADMILTALWELKAEGGSSEEDISHFIEKEYHDLPWAHATILNHHLRDLCKKGRITITHDRCFILSSLKPKPKPSPSPSPSPSPVSSAYSSSSTSISTSPSSSSSSGCWGRPYQTRKRKKVKRRRRKMVRLRGRGRGRGRGRVRSDVEGRNNVEESEKETEDEYEVTSMEVEDDSIKDGDLPDEIAKISEEEYQQNNKELYQPPKAEIDTLNVQSDDEVTVLEVEVRDTKVDEHVEQIEQEEEKGATDVEMELNQHEDNQQSDIVDRQTIGGEQVMDDEKLSEEQDSAMMQCEARVTAAGVEKQHGDTFEEQIQPEEDKEEIETHEQEKGGSEQKSVEKQVEMGSTEKAEPDKQLDHLTKEQVETKEQSGDLHDDDDDDDNDVTEEPLKPHEQCVEKTEGSPQSCKQGQSKKVLPASTEQEEQQTEVNQKEIALAEVQQEPYVENVEQQNQPCIQQTETGEDDSVQEKHNPVRNEDNMTSSGSTSDGSRRPSRPGLRSNSKKKDTVPISKKQIELATPVRRSLRSNKTVSETAVINEATDHSKEHVSGRTRSSKRKPGVAEVGQVSNTRKTRRTGL